MKICGSNHQLNWLITYIFGSKHTGENKWKFSEEKDKNENEKNKPVVAVRGYTTITNDDRTSVINHMIGKFSIEKPYRFHSFCFWCVQLFE